MRATANRLVNMALMGFAKIVDGEQSSTPTAISEMLDNRDQLAPGYARCRS
jgi:hypothetical protein